MTARWRFSIIVMTYDESWEAYGLVESLRPFAKQAEIVIVDGGSDDGTYEKLGRLIGGCALPVEAPRSVDEVLQPVRPFVPGFRLVQTEKSRGWQQNAGAILSRGDALLFLHADTRLPADALDEMAEVLDRSPLGCFGIRFPLINPLMITNRLFSNLRAARGVVFGDQGIFLTRELFFAMGMMPDLPFMEDYEFSLRLQDAGLRPQMTRHRIVASPRAYPDDMVGTWQRMKLIFALRRSYREGVPVEELARRYGDIRESPLVHTTGGRTHQLRCIRPVHTTGGRTHQRGSNSPK